MAIQSLMWTTLPNGVERDGSLRVSVLLSPRLDPGAASAPITDFFPDWDDWPATLAHATFTVHYGGASVKIGATQTSGASRIDLRHGAADGAAWQGIFHKALGVHAFRFEDHADDHVLSYDTTAIAQAVTHLYAKLAASAGDELPTATSLLEDADWKSLIDAVTLLDQSEFDPSTGLRNPAFGFDYLRDTAGQWHGPRERTRGMPSDLFSLLKRMQLFHTPPSKPRPVQHTRTDDQRIKAKWLEHEQVDLPGEDELVDALDFHTVVSALTEYPTLLRRLGLVVDLLIEPGLFPDASDAPLWAAVDFPAGVLQVPTSPTVSPFTHARVANNGRVFEAVSNPSPAPAELRVDSGLLRLDPNRFALLQADVDGSGLKLMDVARTLARLEPEEQRVDRVNRFEKELGAPSLRTAGLMLVQVGRGAALEARFDANRVKNDVAQSIFDHVAPAPPPAAPELWAEDLVRGFRFDIWDASTKLWRSLCQRTAEYELGDGVVVNIEPFEEATVRLAATKSADPDHNEDIIYLHEALVTWSGWSLAGPMPGRAILPDDTFDTGTPETAPVVPDGVPLVTRFRVLPGSLPRLRFGRSYRMRGRAVDLAGNSLPPRRDDFGGEPPESSAEPFLRYEPILPPAIALVRPEGGVTEKPAEGESMERVAIRTFNDTFDDPTPTAEVARRYGVPVQASVRDAEQHGMLDAGGAVDPGTFNMLAHQKDRDAHDPNAALVEELIVSQGPLDPDAVETVYAVYREDQTLTYLPDPLAEEVAVRVLRHPNIDPAHVITIPLYAADEAWPEARPFLIRVFEDATASPSYEASTHTLLVPVPKAIRARVRLSIKPSSAARDTLGVWSWLSDAERQALDARSLDGQHWMLTPWRTLEVVHGVQRPLIAPEIVEHSIWRSRGATSAWLGFEAHCSLKSTARLDLLAEWHEPSDDPEKPESEKVAVDHTRGDTAFSVKITEPEDFARKSEHPRGGMAEHDIIGPDHIQVGGSDFTEERYHEFGDTRYRRIEYRLEGTTRYREFLPAHLLVDGDGEPTEEHISVEGPKLVTWIPSSAPPPTPQVLYIVPTFGWTRTVDDDGTHASWRRGGGLRVYLDRPWMVSGYGEMLAVVLPPADFAGEPEDTPASYPYKNYVTQWGNDPIWKSGFVPGVAPRRSDFPLARTAPDPAGGWLPEKAPATEADQPPGPFRVTALRPPDIPFGSTGQVEVAPHDVFYDDDRHLWYCDIELSPRRSYYPFVRLALARYQPVSADLGAHLSNVVLADFMQLAPDRWLQVNRLNDPLARRVVVHGHTFSDASGRTEATEHSSAVSSKSVVEVWVERLDPARGEDFGWLRVGNATVVEDGTGTRRATLSFVTADRIGRVVQLQAQRNYVTLAREKLADAVFLVQPLWSGTVTLPTNTDLSQRHRLVVAEYEEYLVDPDNIWEPLATKGRRLVFVEHVELD